MCRVVGVGASAGGLEALKRLLKAMPVDTGAAFVLVPHLDPAHESLMAELLSKHTAMPVAEVREGVAVRPNHVYVIPPNAHLTLAQGVLRLREPSVPRGAQTAIDVFLRSLARDQGALAIGIILSGTGSHGTPGAKEIRAAGGLVLAQAPESAEHDQMPRSVISAGVADLVLPPDEMPRALVRHLAKPASPATEEDLSPVVQLLRTQLKRDFRGYRNNMLRRRVKRRMGLRRCDTVNAYLEYLRSHPDEIQALGQDLSIGVTAFFREPDAYRVLEQVVIPGLVQRGGPGGAEERPVRVWVPGCSTGEEAYSIGMLFLEQFASARRSVNLQIFATDIDEDALEVARAGVYPDRIAAEVSAERLKRFFVPTDAQHFQVSKALREVMTFAPQNLVADAPFSRLDLISCRNVLIYLESDVQAKVFALFHFALAEGGYLLLGSAESLGAAADRFEPLSKKWRVYRRIGAGRHTPVEIPVLPTATARARAAGHVQAPRKPPVPAELLHRALLADFSPAAVLVDRRLRILSVQGPVVEYLEFPAGELTHDLLAMARPGLRAAIRGVCQHALQNRRPLADATARVKRQGGYVPCTVTARPVAGVWSEDEGLLVVTFQDRPVSRAQMPATPATGRGGTGRVAQSRLARQLEQELTATRQDLQGTIGELETANEELKASHEEALSMNEELQSANEEMETSKEELQSLNEELSTVNSQLQEKVQELDAANNDMANLLVSSEIAVVFLDAQLRVKRFTPPTVGILSLLKTDIGRPLGNIAPRVPDAALLADCRLVLDTLAPIEVIVRATDGARAYLRRVLPYRTADQRIDGVVITWVDVTRRLAAEAESRHLSAVLRDSNDGVTLVDLDGRIIGWNHGAERLYGFAETEVRGTYARDLAPGSQRETVADLIRRVGRGDPVSESLDTQRTTKDGRTREISLTMTLLRDSDGRPDAIVTTERDITELREGLAAKESARLYLRMIEDLPVGAVLRDDAGLRMNSAAAAITGYQASELPTVGAWCAAVHGAQAADLRPWYDAELPLNQKGPTASLAIVRKDGETRHVEVTRRRFDDGHELWTMADLTDRDRTAQALRRSEEYLRAIVATATDAIITINEHAAIETFNGAAERMFGYTAAEVLGQNVRILMPPPYSNEHDGYIANYVRTRKKRMIGTGREVFGRRKDGSTFPLDLAVSEIEHLGHYTGVLRDLTERRRLEWRLAESHLEERRHLARELHDEIGGHMTGMGLLAQLLQAELEKTQSPLTPRVGELIKGIADAHQRLRAVIRGLMPVEALPEGLMGALRRLAVECEANFGVTCRFDCDPPVHVEDPGTALHLFRIAQEAVNNAVRHGQPSEIELGLARVERRLEISVADDGRGIGAIPGDHPGIGLASMRQRAGLLGGACSVQPRAEGGTVVRCWVPTSAPAVVGAPARHGREGGAS